MICPETNWETYMYSTEEGNVFVRFYDRAIELDKEKYSMTARVIITMKDLLPSGGPTDEHAEELWNLEDTLIDTLKQHDSHCVFVACLTHGESREIIFQVGDVETFRPPVGAWIGSNESFEIDVSEHDGWDFFDSCIWPSPLSWQMIYNRKVIDQLVAASSDVSKIHTLDYVFSGSSENIEKLIPLLKERGYENERLDQDTGNLLIDKKMVVDLFEINNETYEVYQICEELDVVCDGWGAGVEG